MTRPAASKAQNGAHKAQKMLGFVSLTLQAQHPPPLITSAKDLPGSPDIPLSVESSALTAARDDGWQLTAEGVKYAPTAEPNVLGTLVWALAAEAAFENHERHGNMAKMHLAQHWCGMVQRHAEGKLEDLPLELQQDALASAAALAPDVKLREGLLNSYAERRHKLALKKPTPG